MLPIVDVEHVIARPSPRTAFEQELDSQTLSSATYYIRPDQL